MDRHVLHMTGRDWPEVIRFNEVIHTDRLVAWITGQWLYIYAIARKEAE